MKTKECVKCNQVKNVTQFPKKKQRKDGYDTRCKECANRINRERNLKKNISFSKDTLKLCNNCNQKKLLQEFPIEKSGKFGRKGSCKDCVNTKYSAKYNNDHKWREKRAEKQRKSQRHKYNTNNEYREEKLAKLKISRNTDEYREKRNQYERKRYSEDIKYKIRHNMRVMIYSRLRSRLYDKNYKATFDIVPYTLEELMDHLQSKFLPGMSWDNYGKWHIDHIIPDANFNYTSVDDPEFQKCWALDNLQPLWGPANLSKGTKPMLDIYLEYNGDTE